jgi:catechol 2,3-dioxygenase-like lactoylglutathione lyase family enzyme
MKLNHINLVVTNVAEAIHFFETYFKFTCLAVKGDNLIAVLKNDDGFELVLMSSSMNKKESLDYPENFHIGFKQNTKEAVDDIFKKLKTNGIAPEREPGKIRGNYGFYFYFDKIMIEIGTD